MCSQNNPPPLFPAAFRPFFFISRLFIKTTGIIARIQAYISIMDNDMIERVIREARYITQYRTTVRETAKALGFSKSTVHKDIAARLRLIDPSLYKEVKSLLSFNLSVRHIRGGLARAEKLRQKKTRPLSWAYMNTSGSRIRIPFNKPHFTRRVRISVAYTAFFRIE